MPRTPPRSTTVRDRTAVSSLQDPERNLAIGPVGTAEPENLPAGPVPAAEQNLKALPGRLGTLEADASRSEQSLRQLQEYFDNQRSLLASTPSIWPTHGWVTSAPRSARCRTPSATWPLARSAPRSPRASRPDRSRPPSRT